VIEKDISGSMTAGGFARVVAGMMDLHDPTAAGHQASVAELARSIAWEMRHDGELSECVSLAGQIHDIGKIVIPAELLSVPGKLNSMQQNIVGLHPCTGYDIIKPADFPPNVALAVYQHHERLDGTGYPLGLTGDQIILEARILAVADVVQAMLSNRTYHPPLGIETVCNELEMNRNILYDGEVVDTCLRLLKNGGLQHIF
jgi:putative two-component system response regulator